MSLRRLEVTVPRMWVDGGEESKANLLLLTEVINIYPGFCYAVFEHNGIQVPKCMETVKPK